MPEGAQAGITKVDQTNGKKRSWRWSMIEELTIRLSLWYKPSNQTPSNWPSSDTSSLCHCGVEASSGRLLSLTRARAGRERVDRRRVHCPVTEEKDLSESIKDRRLDWSIATGMSESAGGRVKSTSFPPVSRRGRSKSDCPAGLVQRIRQWRVSSGGGLRFPLLYAQPYERAGRSVSWSLLVVRAQSID